MAPKHEGSSDAKKDKKRTWSQAEEEVLITGLKGLVADGWKTDNGFKGGYMNILEDTLRKAFPGTDLRGKPHIDSKLTAWKRTYSALRDVLSRSGVGFNVHGDNRIDCQNVVWEEICRSIRGVTNWRNKRWDHYEAWQEVFGVDRATGGRASEFINMVNDLIQTDEDASSAGGDRAESPINLEQTQAPKPVLHEDSVGTSTFSASKQQKTGKKRVFDESISSLVDLVGGMQQTNHAKYEVISSAFGRQGQVNKTREHVWPLVKKLPGLTRAEMFDVSEKLLKYPECLELFMELEEDARPEYVERVMNM